MQGSKRWVLRRWPHDGNVEKTIMHIVAAVLLMVSIC